MARRGRKCGAARHRLSKIGGLRDVLSAVLASIRNPAASRHGPRDRFAMFDAGDSPVSA
jgi:hypothetical protein